MSELFADDYPTRTEGCGMEPWIDVARAIGLVGIAVVLVVVWFRYWGKGDPHG